MTIYGAVKNPFEPIVGLTGVGLNQGSLYIGLDGQDPETDPQTCYWDAAGLTVAPQPIEILGGYPMRLGTPTQVFTGSTYSMRVRDRNGAQVFYVASAVVEAPVTNGLYNTIAEVETAIIPDAVESVWLSGYYSAGDGGAALYARVASQPTHAGKIQSLDGAWWELSEMEPNVRQFGALGDGIANDTSAIQDAIDYAEARLDFAAVVHVPAGDYEITGLTLTYVTLEGDKPHRTPGSAASPPQYGTRLIHRLGATTNAVTLRQGFGKEGIRNIALQGRQNQNHKTQVAITAVASRTSFTVAPANVPAAPTDVGQAPFYGVCLFFAGDHRLGCGIVSAVNAGTGQITLLAGWDNYATRTGAGNLLTTADKVVFAPRGTWSETLGTTFTNVCDSTRTGYVGISVEGRNKLLENVYVADFHAGIAVQEGVLHLDEVWTYDCALAGIAVRKFGQAADWSSGRLFTQGYYGDDIGQSPIPISIDNASYRTALCAMWGLPALSYFAEVTSDQHIISVIDYGCPSIVFGYLFADKPLKVGLFSFQGINAGAVPDSTIYIDTFLARAVGQNQVTPSPITYPGGQRAVIALTGAVGRQVTIDKCSVTRWDASASAANDFACLYNVTATGSPTENQLFIGSLPTLRGVTTPYAVSPWKAPAPFGYAGASAATPYVMAAKRWIVGSDAARLVGATDANDKEFRLVMFNRLLADPNFQLMLANATASINQLVLGGGDVARQAATEIQFYTTATKGGLGGSIRMVIEGDGRVGVGVTSPLACARFQVGGTDGAFVPPGLTTAQRDAIPSQVNGIMIFNADTGKFQGREGGVWVDFI